LDEDDPLRSDHVPEDWTVAKEYERVTGRCFDDLPPAARDRLWSLPPDAVESDITFAFGITTVDEIPEVEQGNKLGAIFGRSYGRS
jgi:hypothetical protein